jgi:hypothetical protein
MLQSYVLRHPLPWTDVDSSIYGGLILASKAILWFFCLVGMLLLEFRLSGTIIWRVPIPRSLCPSLVRFFVVQRPSPTETGTGTSEERLIMKATALQKGLFGNRSGQLWHS